MSRIYAIREDNGVRFLHRIKCNSCGDEITPNPEISSSGWVKRGEKSPRTVMICWSGSIVPHALARSLTGESCVKFPQE